MKSGCGFACEQYIDSHNTKPFKPKVLIYAALVKGAVGFSFSFQRKYSHLEQLVLESGRCSKSQPHYKLNIAK